MGSETPVTRNLNGIPLKSALRLLLSEYDLDYVIRDDVLMITTNDVASNWLELEVYDVSDRVGPGVNAQEVAATLSMLHQPVVQGMGGGMVMPSDLKIRIVPFHNLLIVYAPQHEHEKIEDLFSQIKAKLNADD